MLTLTAMDLSTYGQEQVLSFISGLSRSLGVSFVAENGRSAMECTPQCRGKKVAEEKRTFTGTEALYWEGDEDQEIIFASMPFVDKEVVENVCLPPVPRTTAEALPPKQVARVLSALVAAPQELVFTVPANLAEQQFEVCVEGPHGPLNVKLPQDAVPGEQRTWRLGPPGQQVVVPEGAVEGSVFDCEVDGTLVHATVPAGKAPGDVFEALPPALVVMIPPSARKGDILEFSDASGRAFQVPVPEGLVPGQYFSLLL